MIFLHFYYWKALKGDYLKFYIVYVYMYTSHYLTVPNN